MRQRLDMEGSGTSYIHWPYGHWWFKSLGICKLPLTHSPQRNLIPYISKRKARPHLKQQHNKQQDHNSLYLLERIKVNSMRQSLLIFSKWCFHYQFPYRYMVSHNWPHNVWIQTSTYAFRTDVNDTNEICPHPLLIHPLLSALLQFRGNNSMIHSSHM